MLIRQRFSNTRESVVTCDFCLSDDLVAEGGYRSDSISVYEGFRCARCGKRSHDTFHSSLETLPYSPLLYSATACGSSA